MSTLGPVPATSRLCLHIHVYLPAHFGMNSRVLTFKEVNILLHHTGLLCVLSKMAIVSIDKFSHAIWTHDQNTKGHHSGQKDQSSFVL